MTSTLFKVAYAQKLLSEFETYFLNRFDSKEIVEWGRSGEFNENLLDNVFDAMLSEIEAEHYSRKPIKKNKQEESSSKESSSKTQEEAVEESEEEKKIRLARERLQRRGNRKPRAYKPKNKKGKDKKQDKKQDKKKRDWDLVTKDMSKITKKDLAVYDRSSASSTNKSETFGCARGEKTELELSLSGEKVEDRDKSGWSFAGLSDFVKSKTSSLLNKELERSDLKVALETMQQKLVSKNVAIDIAAKLCDSVAARLIGRRLNTFTRVGTIVQEALCESIERILTPKRSIDVLRSLQIAKDSGKPYSIVFVGINGVGKSTSLSKVAYFLSNQNFKVKIAACDTFRSGAVEQLEKHGHRLGIEVFSQGYAKNPSSVAAAALSDAKRTYSSVIPFVVRCRERGKHTHTHT